jgi:hypothetical protein
MCANIEKHFELGRRPRQPARPGKVDRESGCGSLRGATKRVQRRPSRKTEGFLFSESVIDPRTVQAYLETDYIVRTEPAFTLRVGHFSDALREFHQKHATHSSAFLTAWNPYSASLADAVNAERQVTLFKELARRSLLAIPAVGQHPSNDWPGEESFLVPDLGLEAAKSLGMRFQQNGIVWTGADGVPQLILLR